MSISSQICPTALLWTTSRNAITGIWGIEISFRYLKHANGLLYFHSKKTEFLKQEIYANLTLYNFGIFIANEAAEENKKKERKNDNKYLYEIDISSALKTARKFFIRRDSDKPIDIIPSNSFSLHKQQSNLPHHWKYDLHTRTESNTSH